MKTCDWVKIYHEKYELIRYFSFGNDIFFKLHMMIRFAIAGLAPIVNSIQLIPQLHKTYITKSVKDLSFYSLLLILIGNLLWLLHGYFIVDTSLIVAGMISMFINMTLLLFYFFYKKRKI